MLDFFSKIQCVFLLCVWQITFIQVYLSLHNPNLPMTSTVILFTLLILAIEISTLRCGERLKIFHQGNDCYLILFINKSQSEIQPFLSRSSIPVQIRLQSLDTCRYCPVASVNCTGYHSSIISFSLTTRRDYNCKEQSFSINVEEIENCHKVSLLVSTSEKIFVENCIDLGEDFWYGGPEVYAQHFASSKGGGSSYFMQPFQLTDILTHKNKLGGASKPIWYNSNGWSVSVESSLSNLWTSFNDTSSNNPIRRNSLCLLANASNSDSAEIGDASLRYEICSHPSPRTAWSSASHQTLDNESKAAQFTSYINTVWHADSLLPKGM